MGAPLRRASGSAASLTRCKKSFGFVLLWPAGCDSTFCQKRLPEATSVDLLKNKTLDSGDILQQFKMKM